MALEPGLDACRAGGLVWAAGLNEDRPGRLGVFMRDWGFVASLEATGLLAALFLLNCDSGVAGSFGVRGADGVFGPRPDGCLGA